MIPPLPPNLGFSFFALPLWERVAAPPAPAIEPAGGDSADRAPEPPPDDPSTPGELVFKGYVWQLQAQWMPFVNPGWDHAVDNDPDEMRERALQHERERRQAVQAPQPHVGPRPRPTPAD